MRYETGPTHPAHTCSIPNSVVSTGRSSGSAAVFVKSRRLTDKVSSRLQLAIDLEIEMIAPAAPLTAGGTLQRLAASGSLQEASLRRGRHDDDD